MSHNMSKKFPQEERIKLPQEDFQFNLPQEDFEFQLPQEELEFLLQQFAEANSSAIASEAYGNKKGKQIDSGRAPRFFNDNF